MGLSGCRVKDKVTAICQYQKMHPVTNWSLLPDDIIKLIMQSYKIQLRHRMVQAELTELFDGINATPEKTSFDYVPGVMLWLEDFIPFIKSHAEVVGGSVV